MGIGPLYGVFPHMNTRERKFSFVLALDLKNIAYPENQKTPCVLATGGRIVLSSAKIKIEILPNEVVEGAQNSVTDSINN